MRERADLYHFHDPELLWVGVLLKLRGLRVVYDVHEDVPKQIMSKHWIPRWARPLVSKGVGARRAGSPRAIVDGIVAATPSIARKFPASKTVVVQNFPEASFARADGAARGSAERPDAFVYTGGLMEIQGVREMAQAFALAARGHDAARWRARSTPRRSRQEIAALPGWRRVRFLGQVPRSRDRRRHRQRAGGHRAQPPDGNYVDAYSTKMFEYMARGLPGRVLQLPAVGRHRRRRRLRDRGRSADPEAIADAIRIAQRGPRARAAARRERQARDRGALQLGGGAGQARGAVSEGRVTLLVEAPAAYEPERRYILDVVLRRLARAGLGASQRPIATTSASPRRRTRGGRCVLLPDVLFATRAADWLTEASLPVRALSGRPARSCTERRAPTRAERLEVDVSAARSSCSRATRSWSSPIATATGASRPAASIAARAGFLGIPIVDAYVELLWEALQRTWPRLRRRPRAFEVAAHPRRRRSARDARSRAHATSRASSRGDLVARGDDPRLRRAARALAARRPPPRSEQHLRLPHGRQRAPRAAQRVLLPRPPRRRPARRPPTSFEHPWVRVADRRASHGAATRSGCTRASAPIATPRRTREEFARLLRGRRGRGRAARSEWGGRQHFLRWANPETWRNWEAAGLDYDCTLAYAEAVGFRTGTCHPYRVFDLSERRPLRLRERPFQVMDVTLLASWPQGSRPRDGDGHRRRMPALRRLPRDPVAQQHAAAHGPGEALVRGAGGCGDGDLASFRARSGPEIVQSRAAPVSPRGCSMLVISERR